MPHHEKDGALTGPDKEHAETSIPALHLLQPTLGHANTLWIQEVLAESVWAESCADQRGLPALFWSNINPNGTFRLGMRSASIWAPPPCRGPTPRWTPPAGCTGSGDDASRLGCPKRARWGHARSGRYRVGSHAS
ncbi:hypothetical protein ACFV16_32020 [Streptomyces massasporeus]|uniref:hypothetical protein n=1 Tax=Streptomyces massasporeus TaxID=67324 RepID=UPI00367E4F26